MEEDISLKKELAGTRDVVRRKYLDMKRDYIESDLARNAALEPIITPLKKLAAMEPTSIPPPGAMTPVRESTPMVTPKRLVKPSTIKKKLFTSPEPKRKLELGVIESWDAIQTPKRSSSDRYQFISKQKDATNQDKTVFVEDPDSNNESTSQSYFEDSQLVDAEMDESINLDPNVTSLYKDTLSGVYPGVGNNVKEYLEWQMNNHRGSDHTYGLKVSPEGFMLGDEIIFLNNDNIQLPDGSEYKATRGLLELLIKKQPDLTVVDEADMLSYKALLLKTNAHLQNYQAGGKINSTKGVKYVNIIRQLFPPKRGTAKTGGSNYIYWNNPNELVERLKLLVASKHAGHNNHDNEIISIIEELKESQYID